MDDIGTRIINIEGSIVFVCFLQIPAGSAIFVCVCVCFGRPMFKLYVLSVGTLMVPPV